MKPTTLIYSSNNPPRGALEIKVRNTNIFTKILICSTGAEVISTLKEHPVDMICWAVGHTDEPTDWLEALRINPAWTDLPILFFTKEEDKENRLWGLEMGACDSVTFVTSTAELAARIRGHLQRSQQINFLRNRRSELAQMALNDALTGLGNRASFDLRLGQEISRSRRTGISFGLLLIDLDHFKWFNDCYGHQTGDIILKAMGRVIADTVRDSDVACRYGGEEFAVILPSTTAKTANQLASRLHAAIAELSLELWQNKKSLTASIGLTCFDGSRLANSSELVEEADTALYQAKNNGRNCTEIFNLETPRLPLDFNFVTPELTAFQSN